MIVVVRQIDPGARHRGCFYVRADLLLSPLLGDEAGAYTLFQIATHCEPVPENDAAFRLVVQTYAALPQGQ
jgi:hypothetical protein